MTGLLLAVSAASAVLLLIRPVQVSRRPSPPVLLAGALLGWTLSAWWLVGHGVAGVVVLLGTAVPAVVVREVRRRRAHAAAARRRDAAIDACAGLASDVRAGLTPTAALKAAAQTWPEFRAVSDAALLGADVPAALRRVADRPGASSLRWVAAAWVVAHRSGAGLADAVELASRAMLEARATAQVLDTELASARATARLLALLPLGVLLLGRGAGGDPFGFLVGTLPGAVVLTTGLLLAWVGMFWIERIAVGILPP